MNCGSMTRASQEQPYLIRGTLEGDRLVIGPLPSSDVVDCIMAMQNLGYTHITATNQESGRVCDLRDLMSRDNYSAGETRS